MTTDEFRRPASGSGEPATADRLAQVTAAIALLIGTICIIWGLAADAAANPGALADARPAALLR